jgi:hypothetical protein
MRRIVSSLLVLVMLLNTAGCSEEWRRKFVRKKKAVAKKPRIWQEQKYKNEPTEAMYSKHYNLAISWLSELADRLGENSKKDFECIDQALAQIYDMHYCLIPDKAKELDKHIKRLEDVRDVIKRQDLGQANVDYVRSTVDREGRFLRSEFYYHKIKDYMKKTFDEQQQEEEGTLEAARQPEAQ